MATFAEFEQKCRAQNVEPNPLLGPQGDNDPLFRGKFSKGPGHPMLQAVVRAAILLRENSGQTPLTPTTDRQLELAAFGDDVPARTLATMCNQSLQPAEPGAVTVLPGQMKDVKGVCTSAEELWIDALEERRRSLSWQPLAEVFTDTGGIDGRPIAARKVENQQTTLTFEPVIIDGIEYPKGSLLNLRVASDSPSRQKRDVIELPVGISVRDVGSVACATFLRLSAFALPLEQRDEYWLVRTGEGRTIEALQGEAGAGMVLTYLNTLESA